MKSFYPEVTVAEKLPLMEHFYTLQGEGYYTGVPAYFIRLAGCDVGCHWCDVKESWNTDGYEKYLPEEIAAMAELSKAPIAVVTGGEPLTYNLEKLTESLHTHKLRTHVETSGVYPVTGSWDWICFSPKKFKKPHPSVFELADELKIIVYNKTDLEWAETLAVQVPPSCHLYLQPEWSKKEELSPLIVDYIKSQPQWRMSLQTHKYLLIP